MSSIQQTPDPSDRPLNDIPESCESEDDTAPSELGEPPVVDSSLLCIPCNEVFPNPNARRYHMRKNHQPYTDVVYPDTLETTRLLRKPQSEGGHFGCLRCSYANKDPDTIRKHAQKCAEQPFRPNRALLPPRIEATPRANTTPTPSSPIPCSSPIIDTPPSSQEELPMFYNEQYLREPTPYTVVHHPAFNLPALAIVIDTRFRSVICMEHQRVTDYSGLRNHIQRHVKHIEFPEDLVTRLETEYNLVHPADIAYTNEPIEPVFGVPILPNPHHFCGDCGRGYMELETLRVHHATPDRCTDRIAASPDRTGYGQAIVKGKFCRIFQVDVSKLRRIAHAPTPYSQIFIDNHPLPVDYSKNRIRGPEDDLNLSQFYYHEGWIQVVDSYSPAAIIEACRNSTEDDQYGQELKDASRRYLTSIQAVIRDHTTNGLPRTIAQLIPDQTSNNVFNAIGEAAINKYSLTLHRLIFNIIRQLFGPWESLVKYPTLAPVQQEAFRELINCLQEKKPATAIDACFHQVCLAIFGHEKHVYETSRKLDKFFSPVNTYVVYRSVKPAGNFDKASNITQTIAHLTYSIRATYLKEIATIATTDSVREKDVYERFKPYLMDGYDTPMAFLFNINSFLGTIRGSEVNEAQFMFNDDSGREVTHFGHSISLDNVKRMIDAVLKSFHESVKENLFFGEEIPSHLIPTFEIEDLVDNLQNRSPGYCFLDDPKNPFLQYRTAYGEWLLSDPQRAAKFVYVHDGKLVWKPVPCQAFLKASAQCILNLMVGIVWSAGPSTRGTEFARQILRNMTGAYRNIMILFRVFCVVAIQDKTSHKRLKDRFVPHAPTREFAKALIIHLAVIRPFEQFLVEQHMSQDDADRYRYQLWPNLKRSFSSEDVSDHMGKIAVKYLEHPYKIQWWRNIVTVFLSRVPDEGLYELHKEYYVDTANMHSTNMSALKYAGNMAHLPNSDHRATLGCIKVSIAWQRLVNIGQDRPLSVSSDERRAMEEYQAVLGENNPSENGEYDLITNNCDSYISIRYQIL
ncbi:hypothetical protein BDZ97DRAFT_1925160 [Flammula alnicola]|nr:hypothetical protein BDZ97DRAFT_1925160 [Flammula alnicola]